jgi:hypothetical protein
VCLLTLYSTEQAEQAGLLTLAHWLLTEQASKTPLFSYALRQVAQVGRGIRAPGVNYSETGKSFPLFLTAY